MHPDLYLSLYRSQERRLEQRLQRRVAAAERGVPPRVRGVHLPHLTLHRRPTHG
ncbi:MULTISPECIES: hypothetical protein [unclassified Actinotalea]|uniref:hypothetical protein n=1 Tax=unclassified Actinotalea TaxID=2638618 RepID=UPI0015F4731D|nr:MULTISPECIES: hypothetical protein [unclassified Actinotalea]